MTSKLRRARHRAWGAWACLATLGACSARREPDAPDSAAPAASDASTPSESDAGIVGCAPGDAPRICDFAHMALRVTDLAAARAFYGSFLGLREPFAVAGNIAVFKINDYQFIEIHEEAAPPGDTNFQLRDIAFSTPDAEALRSAFASKNVHVPPAVAKNVLGNTSFTTTDPDGHVMEWVQYEPDSLTGKTMGQAMPDSQIGTSVHHLGVTIMDPVAASAYYEGALGFSKSSTADKEAARAPDGTVRIEYGVTHSAPTHEFAVVRDHLCLRVADTMKAVRLLAARDPSAIIEHHVLDGFTVRANVYDPDGTRIELADSVLLPAGEQSGSGDMGELDSGSSD